MATLPGGAQEACGVRFSDPAGSSFGRGGELFVANCGSKEIVHLWLDESGEGGGADGVGGGGAARLQVPPQSSEFVTYTTDSSLGVQVDVIETLQVFPSSLGRGRSLSPARSTRGSLMTRCH